MKFARIIAATACVFAFLPAVPLSAATRDVDIPGRFFQPQRTSIIVGSTIRWANSSSERHSVRAMSGSREQFASSDSCKGALLFNDCIRPGGTFSHTFSQRGTFFYYCELHGSDAPFPNCGMCGRIAVVRQSSGTIAPVTPGSASPTATATSPSPSPNETGSPTPSPGSISTSPIAAPGDDGSTSIVAIAAVTVVLLGGSGYLIYRTMIR